MPHVAARRALKNWYQVTFFKNVTWYCLFGAAVALQPAHGIYKWVDEKGVTHFSEHPPADGRKATKVEPKVTPPSGPAAAPTDWKKKEQDSRKQRIERDQTDEAARARAHNDAAERANKCNRAKRDLEVLSLQVPVYSKNERGERVYVEDKDRESEKAAARRVIEANCDAR